MRSGFVYVDRTIAHARDDHAAHAHRIVSGEKQTGAQRHDRGRSRIRKRCTFGRIRLTRPKKILRAYSQEKKENKSVLHQSERVRGNERTGEEDQKSEIGREPVRRMESVPKGADRHQRDPEQKPSHYDPADDSKFGKYLQQLVMSAFGNLAFCVGEVRIVWISRAVGGAI